MATTKNKSRIGSRFCDTGVFVPNRARASSAGLTAPTFRSDLKREVI